MLRSIEGPALAGTAADRPSTSPRIRQFYDARLRTLYGHLVAAGAKVLVIGGADPALLSSLAPAQGTSLTEVEVGDSLAEISGHDTFDYILLPDVVNGLWDVQATLASLAPRCRPETRIIMNFHSNLWRLPRAIASLFGLVAPLRQNNWLTREDVVNLLYLAGFETINARSEVMLPVYVPLLSTLLNRFAVKLWPLQHLGFTNFVVARQLPVARQGEEIVSVIVPVRDEAGNIRAIFDRTPKMGAGTELVFVEGGSKDGSYEIIEKEMLTRQRPLTSLHRQMGKGKGNAVTLGFEKATGDVLMILDSDLTVAPEDLPRFYDVWKTGRGELINGVRMVYPMEGKAMPFVNMIGNKVFSIAFSYILRQKVKDTACGTKVISRVQYDALRSAMLEFEKYDRFGDWALLFSAARNNIKIVDLPIRYRSRSYGVTKMQRWRTGVLLLMMVSLGLRKLRFV